jgi:hypothetical protein
VKTLNQKQSEYYIADINADYSLLVANTCTPLKKIVRFRKDKPRCKLEKKHAQRQEDVTDSVVNRYWVMRLSVLYTKSYVKQCYIQDDQNSLCT